MNFFKNKYLKIFAVSFLVGSLGLFFGSKIWAAVGSPGGAAAIAQQRAGAKKALSPELTAAIQKQQQGVVGSTEQDSDDAYTQSEAHLQVDAVKEKMKNFPLYAQGAVLKEGEVKIEKTPNEMVAPYLNIVSAVLDKEVELKNTHYVFYHGQTNQWRVPQDLYKLLYAYYHPMENIKDFSFIRFTDMPLIKAKDYLLEHVTEYAGVNDNLDKTILPVNLALFGGVGFPGECTWNYFIMNKSHKWPFPENYQAVLDAFNLSYDTDALIKETDDLAKMLVDASPEQTILQIFIPKEKVDDIAYLAWIIGFPAHPKSMELVEKIIGNKPKVGNVTGSAVKKLMKQFKKEGEDNLVYQELLESVENGDFGADAFLKVYRNNPWKLKNINDTQARLMITSDGLLNPKSGIKFFNYFTTPRKVQEAYLKKVEALAKKIIERNKSKAQ